MAASTKLPVVVILGATGSGKSKLALEIGRVFNAEIISADSMQIYKGLDIITNKVTTEEQRQCPHHMIDYLSPLHEDNTVVEFRNAAVPIVSFMFYRTEQCPNHMIDYLSRLHEDNTVVEFRNAAVPIIDRLLQKGTLPIVVGGTSYYIESLLWNFLINKQDVVKTKSRLGDYTPENPIDFGQKLYKYQNSKKSDNEEPKSAVASNKCEIENETRQSNSSQLDSQNEKYDHKHFDDAIRNLSDTESDSDENVLQQDQDDKKLHQRLFEIDPETAKRLHPNDHRKIKRALQVYEQHGLPMSEILRSQKSGEPELAKSGPLRYPHTCVFYIQSELKVLDTRINERVDKMLEAELVNELLDFHQQYNIMRVKENKEVDYTLGIFQSIGFKEFHEYLILPPSERDTDKGKQLLQEGIDNMKLVTRQYARKQIKRIKGRFLRRPGTDVPPVYGLDATDVSQWEENVYKPAVSILTDILEGRQPSISPLPYDSENVNLVVHKVCEACGGKVFIMQSEWEIHLQSKRHKKRVRNLKRRSECTNEVVTDQKTKCFKDTITHEEKEKDIKETEMSDRLLDGQAENLNCVEKSEDKPS